MSKNSDNIYTNSDGDFTRGGLVLSGSTLYGTASSGGLNGNGTVFAVNTDGTGFRLLHTFSPNPSPDFFGTATNSDGATPYAQLVLSNDVLYGATISGGPSGVGTIFRIKTDGTGFTVLYNLDPVTTGGSPWGRMVLSGDTLYGTTFVGGSYGGGAVFAAKTDGSSITLLHNFGPILATNSAGVYTNSDGTAPFAGLTLSGSTLYGTASLAGLNGEGTIFAVNTDGTGFTVLHSFAPTTGPYEHSTNTDGDMPWAELLLAGNTLYGTANSGGVNDNGTVFAINTDGSDFRVLHTFSAETNNDLGFPINGDGAHPIGGLISSGNTLYGTASQGGTNFAFGTLFQINSDGTGFKTLHHFFSVTSPEGASPEGTLILSGNTLYGTTAASEDAGTVFKFSPGSGGGGGPLTGNLQVSISPPASVAAGASWQLNGGPPQNGGATLSDLSPGHYTVSFTPILGWTTPSNQVVSVSNGATAMITGTYVANPPNSLQVIITPAEAVAAGAQWRVDGGALRNSGTTLTGLSAGDHTVSFTSVLGWTTPSNLTVSVSGNAAATAIGDYVPTSLGSLEATLTTIYKFSLPANGFFPYAGLVSSGSSLYGTTLAGGGANEGTVFKVSTDGTSLKTLYSFTALNHETNKDGASIYGDLVLSGAMLYGTAYEGGGLSNGTVFAVNTDGTGFKVLHTFPSAGPNDGVNPITGLLLSGDRLYGTTFYGGGYDVGTVFAVNTNGTGFTILHTFNGSAGEGILPHGDLILSGNTLYGTTYGGGPAIGGLGSVFALNTDGTGFRTLYGFSRPFINPNGGPVTNSDGMMPQAGLVLSGETLYGTTYSGGSNGYGTVFAINTDGSGFGVLHSFTVGNTNSLGTFTNSDGAHPQASLILLGGTLFGTAGDAGADGYGTVFAVNTDGTGFANLHSFSNRGGDGAFPWSRLLKVGSDLYGTTYAGGTLAGTLFKLSLGATNSQSGSLQVTISPPGAVGAGAMWQVDGGSFQRSGATVAGLDAGSHTVTFKTIPGYTTPADQSVLITAGHTASVSGVYLARDISRPLLSITAPLAGLRWSNALYTVKGTAKDNVAVSNIVVLLNGLSFPVSTTNNWTNWWADVVLTEGSNGITAFAQDSSGNLSLTNTRSINYIVSDKLQLSNTGLGSFTPNYSNSWLQTNVVYKITGKPGPGFVLSNWVVSVGLPGDVFIATTNPLSFTMKSNTAIVANFVVNPFNQRKGGYTGLFGNLTNAANGLPQSQNSSGLFTLSLMGSGSYSASLRSGNNMFQAAGQFSPDGSSSTSLKRSGRYAGTLNLNLALTANDNGNAAPGHLTGSMWDTNGMWLADLAADRYQFDVRTNAATNFMGKYTLIIRSPESPATAQRVPGGNGFATITVSPAGQLSLLGNLADGTPISQNVPLSQDGQWPFYNSLYAGGGSVWAWMKFGTNEPPDNIYGDMSWIKPAKATDKFYPGGFSDVFSADGSIYMQPVSTTNRFLALSNAVVVFEGGNLSSFTNNVKILPSSQIINTSSNKLTMSVSLLNGKITGTVTSPPPYKGAAISIYGAAFQNTAAAYGYYLGTNLSGGFELTAPPSPSP